MDTNEQEGISGIGCFVCFALIAGLGILLKLGELFGHFCSHLNNLCKGYLLVYFIIFCTILLVCYLVRRNFGMLERLLMNPEEKEFAKLTVDLSPDKYVILKAYFKATGTSTESSNNFLKSCHGLAFLEAYKKSPIIDNIEISKMILNVEREEQIISCAVDVLKAY